MKMKLKCGVLLTLCNYAFPISSYLRMDDMSEMIEKRLMSPENHSGTMRDDQQRYRSEDRHMTKMYRTSRACMAEDNLAHIYAPLQTN